MILKHVIIVSVPVSVLWADGLLTGWVYIYGYYTIESNRFITPHDTTLHLPPPHKHQP